MNLFSGKRRRLGVCLFTLASLLAACRKEATFQQNFDEALKNIERGKEDLALAQLRRALEQNPEHVETQFHLAMLSLKVHDDVAAYTVLRRLEEADRKSSVSAPTRLALAKILLAVKNDEQAGLRLIWVLQREPANQEARGLLATALAQLTQPADVGLGIERVLQAGWQVGAAKTLHIDPAAEASAEAVLTEGVRMANRSTESLTALANFYELTGHSPKAAGLFEEMIQRDPRSIPARSSIGWLHAQSGDRENAEKTFREITEIAPTDPKAAMALVDFYRTIDEFPKAITELEAKAQKEPNPGIQNALAQTYYSAGRTKDAEALVDDLLRRNPRDPEAQLLKALLYMNRQGYLEAIGAIQQVMALQNDLQNDMPVAHYLLGEATSASGNEQGALQNMEQALRLNRTLLKARLWLMRYHLRPSKETVINLSREATGDQQRDPELVVLRALATAGTLSKAQQDALNDALLARPALILAYGSGLAPLLKESGNELRARMDQAAKKDPGLKPVQGVLARILDAQAKQTTAIVEAERKVAASPYSVPDLLELARLQVKSGQLPAAKANLEKAGRIDPDSQNLLVEMAEEEEASGNLETSRNYLEQLARKYPKSSEAWERLGVLHEKRHSPAEAKAAYQKSLETNPRNAAATNSLAHLLAASGDLDHALILARKAHELEAANAGFSGTLGWIQYKKGDYPSALENLGAAVNRLPEDATLRYRLAMTQRKTGRDREALSNLQSALKLNPRIPEAGDIVVEISALQKSVH